MSGAAWRRKKQEKGEPSTTSLLQLVADSRKHAHLRILLVILTTSVSRWRYVQLSGYNRNRGITRRVLPSLESLQKHLLVVPSSKTKKKRSSSRRKRKRKRKFFLARDYNRPSPKKTPPPNSVMKRKPQGAKSSTRLGRRRRMRRRL
jgi:hypothetical protein